MRFALAAKEEGCKRVESTVHWRIVEEVVAGGPSRWEVVEHHQRREEDDEEVFCGVILMMVQVWVGGDDVHP